MDDYYMQRALQLAEKGCGSTRPNPLVGAVIVKDGQILAEGYHQRYGSDHAEVAALKKINFQAKGTTMYVNLEPCAHYGKTPPCVEAIIQSGVRKVVVAMVDPHHKVAGKGLKRLQEAGIEVLVGVQEKEARKLNEIFIKYITTQLPFCILKTAMTLDGKIATITGESKWITGETARAYVHHLRNRVSAILVGVQTIIQDNPQLNTRIHSEEVNQPIRVVVDSSLHIPLDSYIVETAMQQPTWIATTKKAPLEKIKLLEAKGAQVFVLPEKEGRVDLVELVKQLGEREVDSFLLEGGGTLNYAALEAGIVDKVLTFIAPKIIGGSSAKTPVEGKGIARLNQAFQLQDISVKMFAEDVLVEGYLARSN
ncbi:MAG: bifunctional diaminohydroxyphosphoribosylaminopyrimidine deaminase/5-amino-6-(5-phosphoribosylamino)uracil reductase RibD [Cyanobacteriota bacterium]